jgi:hypothetical protein
VLAWIITAAIIIVNAELLWLTFREFA